MKLARSIHRLHVLLYGAVTLVLRVVGEVLVLPEADRIAAEPLVLPVVPLLVVLVVEEELVDGIGPILVGVLQVLRVDVFLLLG